MAARALRVAADKKERSIVLEDLETARSRTGAPISSDLDSVPDLQRAVDDGQRKVERLRREQRNAAGHPRENMGLLGYQPDQVPLYWAIRELVVDLVDKAIQDYHANRIVIFHHGHTAAELDRMVARQVRQEGGGSAVDEQAAALYRALVFETCREAITSIFTELEATEVFCKIVDTVLLSATAASDRGSADSVDTVLAAMRLQRSSATAPTRRMIWRVAAAAKETRAKVDAANPWALTAIRVETETQTVAARPQPPRHRRPRVPGTSAKAASGGPDRHASVPDRPTAAPPMSRAGYVDCMTAYWSRFATSVHLLPVPVTTSGIMCAESPAIWHPHGRFVCGTVAGTVLVYDSASSWAPWTLLAATTKDSKSDPVINVCMSASGRQVLAVYRSGVARLYQLQRGVGGKRKANLPPYDLVFSRAMGPTVNLGSNPLLSTKPGTTVVRAIFLPLFTLLGEQNSAVLMLSDGTLVVALTVDCEAPRVPSAAGGGQADRSAKEPAQQSSNVRVLESLGEHYVDDTLFVHVPQYLGVCSNGAGIVVVSNNGRMCMWENGIAGPQAPFGATKPTWVRDVDLTLRKWHVIPESTIRVTLVSDGRAALTTYVASLALPLLPDRVWTVAGAGGGGEQRCESHALYRRANNATFATLTYGADAQLAECSVAAYFSSNVNLVKILDIQPTTDRDSLLLLLLYPRQDGNRARVTVVMLPISKDAECKFRVDLTITDPECVVSVVACPPSSQPFLYLRAARCVPKSNIGGRLLG